LRAHSRRAKLVSSLTHRWILNNGGFLQTLFSSKQLDSRIYPATLTGEMILYPEQNSGSYFELQQRNTQLYQWSQTLHLHPMQILGTHLPTSGYSWSHSSYQGQVGNFPIQVLHEDYTLSSSINYPAPIASQATADDFAFFAQDNWQIHPRFTMDLGLRLDHDSLSADRVNAAPRIGFVFAPTRDNRTAIRGGFGVFYDKIPLNVSVFDRFPAQTITASRPTASQSSATPPPFRISLPARCTSPTALAGRCSLTANCTPICSCAWDTKSVTPSTNSM
jgi:outer membrane receptor protein involved in Fe transport